MTLSGHKQGCPAVHGQRGRFRTALERKPDPFPLKVSGRRIPPCLLSPGGAGTLPYAAPIPTRVRPRGSTRVLIRGAGEVARELGERLYPDILDAA